MFTLNHLIWIIICVLFVTILLIITLKCKLNLKVCSYIISGFCFVSEIFKIFTNFEKVVNLDGEVGYVLGPGYLPFHLCSILIFLIFIVTFTHNENKKEKLLSFLTPIGLIGGIMAILIPTSGVDFTSPFPYQCFVYHAVLIWFSLYLMITKQVKLGIKEYLRNIITLVCLMFIMIWVNSILKVYDTNFFYVVRPPMSNLPILNLNHGYFVYLFSLITIGLILMTIVHLYFIIVEIKKKKNEHN